MRREQHRAGDDQRLLIFFADLLPVFDVREQALVRLEILFFLDRRRACRRGAGAGRSRPLGRRTSISGRTSASMTRRSDLVRSWLRSSRVVSRLPSTSSVPPEMKPATSTRWNAADIELRPDRRLDRDFVVARARRQRAGRRRDYRPSLLSRAVIDFLEQLVVLLDVRVVRLELQRLLVGVPRFVEIALVLVARWRGCYSAAA